VYLSKHVGLGAYLRVLAPTNFTGTGLWVGTGGVDLGTAAGGVIARGGAGLGLASHRQPARNAAPSPGNDGFGWTVIKVEHES